MKAHLKFLYSRLATAVTVAATALMAGAAGASAADTHPAQTGQAGPVSTVAAAPTFETFTNLNMGKNLASLNRKVIATTPQPTGGSIGSARGSSTSPSNPALSRPTS